MKIKGKIWKLDHHIDTDLIIAARYLNTSDSQELASHLLEDYDKDFAEKITKGDIIVAGENFGCGSSREHAPIAIKSAGIACIIAQSFARIFFRNAINIGLPILESYEAFNQSEQGQIIEIDTGKGLIKNLSNEQIFTTNKLPEFIQQIIASGGLVEYAREKIKKRGKNN